MSWTYNANGLNIESADGRLNSVRFLVGDVDTADQQVSNEEITFALSQNRNNIYLSGSFIAGILAAKYSREVDTSLGGGALSEKASAKAKAYLDLQTRLRSLAQRQGAGSGAMSLGVSSGELKVAEFSVDQFDIEATYNERG